MCTLTFFPKPNQEGFILTFNRDEAATRSSVDIVDDVERGLVYPKDTLHGGTWLAFSRLNGRFVCLLNGAFERHERQLSYRKSRGLVLLESFESEDIFDFWQHYDLSNIEPFTMIAGQNNRFFQFRWDGFERHTLRLDTRTPRIWSSCTLYNQSVRSRRENWFSDFLRQKNSQTTAADLWQFHETPKMEETENGILMYRPKGPSTVSITQLNYSFSSQLIDFQYYELKEHDIIQHQFAYGENLVAH
jgi:hypothetical protein